MEQLTERRYQIPPGRGRGLSVLAATLRALAFIFNAAVFAVGWARAQGRLAPPDYLYVGLLFAAPLVSLTALVLGYRRKRDPEVLATAKAAAYMLNALLLVFVVWLAVRLPPETLAEETLWILTLFAAPAVNAAALIPDWHKRLGGARFWSLNQPHATHYHGLRW
jgi:surface polysaccharide O-acyltransferase-like enzyme